MIRMNLLKKGDQVLSINEQFLAVRRRNGEVELYRVYFTDAGEIGIDPLRAGIIGFGDGTVSKQTDDGRTTVYEF